MSEQEAVAYIEEWDVTEAAKVLKWYEEDELLRPCDCDTIVAIETENLQAENAKLRELVRDTYKLCWNGLDCTECPRSFYDRCDKSDGCSWLGILHDRMWELGMEVDA